MKKIKLYNTEPRTQAEAQKRADVLAKYMRKNLGGVWDTRVWENLGWHYKISIGSISLSYHTRQKFKKIKGKIVCAGRQAGDFSALVSDKKGMASGGLGNWTSSSNERDSKNPVTAVINAIARMEDVVLSYLDVMNDNRKLLKQK